jgi:hypothetical protein
MPDWYRTHGLGPEHYPDTEYRDWAQDNGLYVDVAGNVDYGPPEPVREFQPSMENARGRDWRSCSDLPVESCSDAACPVHGDERALWDDYESEDDDA